MCSIKTKLWSGAAAIVVATLIVASPALAEELSPWWGLTESARPSNIQPGAARNEKVKITVSATEGGYYLIARNQNVEWGYHLFAWNATHQEVQEGLEEIYGAGNVEVPTGEGNATGSDPYEVVFTGADADREMYHILKYAFLKGGNESLTLDQTPGRPDGIIALNGENLGDGDASGSVEPITITDALPPGLKAVWSEGRAGLTPGIINTKCSAKPTEERAVTCAWDEILRPFEPMEVRIGVIAQNGAKDGEENTATMAGGGAAEGKTIKRTIHLNAADPSFGVEEATYTPEEAGGKPDTHAGSHPFQVTTDVVFNQALNAEPVAMVKDVHVFSPPGLIGNPTPVPQCTDVQFSTFDEGAPQCPANTVIGVADITFDEPEVLGEFTSMSPVFNMVPNTGEPARFGFYAVIAPVMLDTSVRTGSDYGVTVSSNNVIELAGLLNSSITLWGVPYDHRHDAQRGFECLYNSNIGSGCQPASGLPKIPPPFLSLPTSCTGPLQASVELDSWSAPKQMVSAGLTEPMPAMDGCNHLPFSPELSVAPDAPNGSMPSGLSVQVHVPQTAALNPTGLAESTLRDTTVALPQGVTVDPSGADGLAVCSESEIGFLPGESSAGHLAFTSEMSAPFCPNASKIGTVEVETPLLPRPLTGAAYLAPQNENPFGALLAMYLVAQDPVSGTLVKIPGEVRLDEGTGQMTAVFKDTPQLPFENLRLHFYGGARGPLATPALCGRYTTVGSFAPWSGEAPVTASSQFDITAGPGGSACQDPLPFSPILHAGSPNLQAGAFSPFSMTMSREDGNQNLEALTLHMPPGLTGTLAKVQLCPEPQADEGACGPGSQIGETTISVGLGTNPFTVSGGRVYITGPYKGAPYGLSIVNPAKAGPFDVGQGVCDCVVVRAKIEVDPTTAALTITSDTSGPYRIPEMLHGIPLEIKHINVTINRQDFTFNPTNCEKMAITGTLTSREGATEDLSVPFQVTNCATLAFHPHFSVSTSAHTSRTEGASLDAKLTYAPLPFDKQSNVAKVKVELPRQLPSRLTTLQRACPDTTFNANPANCPAASEVGEAVASTPIIPTAFKGPAYFVSHGGAKFPELIIELSGYGTTVYLHGETFISKAGVTSTTFNTVPDVPIGSFELKLPAGPDSALAANGDLCASKLVMPTTFTAQNGAVVKQNTAIAVEGCAPELRIIRHKVLGKTATVEVEVPSAGKLVAGGSGLSRVTRSVASGGTVTVTLRLSKKDQRFVIRHHGRRLMAPIKLSFTPSHGKRLNASVAVLMR